MGYGGLDLQGGQYACSSAWIRTRLKVNVGYAVAFRFRCGTVLLPVRDLRGMSIISPPRPRPRSPGARRRRCGLSGPSGASCGRGPQRRAGCASRPARMVGASTDRYRPQARSGEGGAGSRSRVMSRAAWRGTGTRGRTRTGISAPPRRPEHCTRIPLRRPYRDLDRLGMARRKETGGQLLGPPWATSGVRISGFSLGMFSWMLWSASPGRGMRSDSHRARTITMKGGRV